MTFIQRGQPKRLGGVKGTASAAQGGCGEAGRAGEGGGAPAAGWKLVIKALKLQRSQGLAAGADDKTDVSETGGLEVWRPERGGSEIPMLGLKERRALREAPWIRGSGMEVPSPGQSRAGRSRLGGSGADEDSAVSAAP